MTIEEYSTLMGYEETCEMAEYETANFIYMMAGEMDKQTFCNEYKKTGSSPLVLELAKAAHRKEMAHRTLQGKERDVAHAILRQADGIRIDGYDEAADQLDKIASKQIGRKDCIKWKLHKGYRLSETDNEYITDNLR